MASITSTGIGSGLDIAGLVGQLVAAEAAPVETRLGIQEAKAQSKLSAFGSLKSALADFRDQLDAMRKVDSLQVRKAASENEDLFTVSVSKNALPAKYSIEVQQLAQAQRLSSGAFAASDTVIGTGTLTIATASESLVVEIGAENNTLAGIRDAINSAPGNPGFAATIVNADAGSYLLLSGNATGVANAMTVTQTDGDGGLAALEYDPGNGLNALTESVAAQDALVRIDGFEVASTTNVIDEAIDGVTLNLVAADPDTPFELDVANDHEAVLATVDSFVEKYNGLVAVLDELTIYDAETQVSGPLLGDTTARGVRDQIRRALSESVTDIEANFSSLTEVGIEVQLDGTLSVDTSRLSTVLNEDFNRFGQLFTGSDGYAVRIYDIADSYLQTGGALQTRTEGLNAQIESVGEQRESLNARLSALQTRLLRQFNALDSLLGELNQTSNFLSQQLTNLPGFTQPRSN